MLEFRVWSFSFRIPKSAIHIQIMSKEELKIRYKAFALRVMKMVEALPSGLSADVIAKQVVRCATSVAANYRAACRARSKAEFIAKLGIVEEEADETLFWLEMIEEAELLPASRLEALKTEANEIVAITVTSIKTAKK